MPLTGLLLLVQGFSECLKCVHAIRFGHWPDRHASASEVLV